MIYDCFIFFNELDMLDIRLHEMSDVVDKFVLVEANKTFQGHDKPLYYADNKRRYATFSDKIIHVVVEFPDDIQRTSYSRHQNTTAWAREHYQRDQIERGLSSAQPNDLVIISDVDEIIAAHRLKDAIHLRRRHDLTVFTMPIYAHFVNRRVAGDPWLRGPRMIEFDRFTSGQKMRMARYRLDREINGPLLKRLYLRARNIPRRIRTRIINRLVSGIGNRLIEIPDSGWHMSSIGSWEHYRHKLNAYSHEEYKNRAALSDEQVYMESILSTTYEVSAQELPEFIRMNQDLLSKLGWSRSDSSATTE